MTETDELGRVVDELLDGFARGWNAGDAEAFAGHLHEDVEFVDVLGRHHRGRAAVERELRQNFATIHAGSRVRFERLAARRLGQDLVLAHSSAEMHVPAGPLAGDNRATQTLVLDPAAGVWRVRAFHNTVVREMPGRQLLADASVDPFAQ
jgi:uncharacterized protein (TIGR02246 family)